MKAKRIETRYVKANAGPERYETLRELEIEKDEKQKTLAFARVFCFRCFQSVFS